MYGDGGVNFLRIRPECWSHPEFRQTMYVVTGTVWVLTLVRLQLGHGEPVGRLRSTSFGESQNILSESRYSVLRGQSAKMTVRLVRSLEDLAVQQMHLCNSQSDDIDRRIHDECSVS